ncbi:hypothetical protein L204_100137 [Cryptococcus depauperatus]
MKKTLGPIVVIDTNPPHRPWDGNQATSLFFPVFIAFLLTLLSTLGTPMVKGLSVIDVDTGVNGTVKIGLWGWCGTGIPNITDHCSTYRGFSSNFSSILSDLPEPVHSLADISTVLPSSFMTASGVMHIFACAATWLSVIWTLAATGQWSNQRQNAYDWTRWAFTLDGFAFLFILIAWSLDLGMLVRISNTASNVDDSEPKFIPGPVIFLLLVSWLVTAGAYLVRLFWGRYKTRPLWTTEAGHSDFHPTTMLPGRNDYPTMPHSGGLPPSEELPPSWNSLNLHEQDAKVVPMDADMAKFEWEKPDVERRGFPY